MLATRQKQAGRSETSSKKPLSIRRMSEQEFVDWCRSDIWAEWADGEVILMSPVSWEHADVASFLLHLFRGFVEEYDLGKVVTEPFQTRFARLRRRRSPDIIFISHDRMNLIRANHLEGAPDLIVEVVSPDSQSRDRREKFGEYQSAGVREYWIVDPLSQSVEAYELGKGKKFELIEEKDGAIHSTVLSRFYIKPAWLWRQKLPKVSDLLRDMTSKR